MLIAAAEKTEECAAGKLKMEQEAVARASAVAQICELEPDLCAAARMNA